MNLIAVNERDVEEFERLAYGRRYEAAGRALLALLPRVQVVFGARGYEATREVEEYLYTRIAAALTILLADESYVLQPAGFVALALKQTILTAILEASAYCGSDHLVRLIGSRDPANPETVHYTTPQQLLRLLLAYSLDSDVELGLEGIFRQDPALSLPVYLSMLGRYVVLSRNAERRHAQLLRLGSVFEDAEGSTEHMPALASVWMNCMYAMADDRHEVKRHLNVIARRGLGPLEAVESLAAHPRGALSRRPVMLIPLEHFRVEHVNHRTYAALVRGLRQHFTLVGAGTRIDFDAESTALFDSLVELPHPDDRNLPAIARKLAELRADIAFYPTLGIQWWWIPICNVRLAPIQAMSMGVPATSHSRVMDYVVVEESWAGEADCYSETLVHTRAGSTRFQRRDSGLPRGARLPRSDNAVTRVAVPALVTKLNATFLDTCAQIDSRSRTPLEWHFLAGMSGLHHAITRRQILRWLPRSRVYGYMDYAEYMRLLATCDLHLSTFPFGGTNTNLDSMHLGIPMVTLTGRECHSQIDAGMMRRVGLPPWLITRTPAAYADAALRLIHSPEERARISAILAQAPLDDLFTDLGSSARDDFVAAFCWLYEAHDELRQHGKRCWTVADRAQYRR